MIKHFLIISALLNIGFANESSTSEALPDPLFELPNNLTLRKCRCGANQELIGSECIEKGTYIYVNKDDTYQTSLFKTSDFSNVVISPIKCTHGYREVNITGDINEFKIITSGGFLSIFGLTENYCLDNIPDGLTALTCLPNPRFELPKDLTLRKCQCGANQELVGSECIEKETYIYVNLDGTHNISLFRTSEFSNTVISTINCPQGSIKKMITSERHKFYVQTNGTIVGIFGTLENYCFENIPGGWAAIVCLPIPLVPICCPKGYYLMTNGSCIAQKSSELFTPPLNFYDEILEKSEVSGPITNITCSDFSDIHQVNLGSEVNLLYGTEKAILEYFPSSSPSSFPVEEFCIGLETSDNDEQQYSARFCFTDIKKDHYHKCKNATCVRKCCLSNQFLYNVNCVNLVEGEEHWKLPFHEKDTLLSGIEPPESLFVIQGLPLCNKEYMYKRYLSEEEDQIYLLDDGSLHYPNLVNIEADSYCIEKELIKDGQFREIAIICASENELDSGTWNHILNAVLYSLSSVFLLGSIFVYVGAR